MEKIDFEELSTMTTWNNLEKYDFEAIFEKLPDDFEFDELAKFLDVTDDMVHELFQDANPNYPSGRKMTLTLITTEFLNILLVAGVIKHINDAWYKKVK